MNKRKLKQKIDLFLTMIFLMLLFGGVAFFGISIFKGLTKTNEFKPKVAVEKFSEYYPTAEKVLKNMSLEEKVGQFLFARVPERNATEEIDTYHLGGYILFGRDVNGFSLEQIKNKVLSWQNEAKYGLFIGIDEEGGSVSRLTRAGLADFRSPQALFLAGGMELIKSDAIEKNQILEGIGVNVNFAPVADVATDKNAYIFGRSFGKSASETAEFVRTIVGESLNSNVSATLKHFPGYGNNLNTHIQTSIDERSLEELRASDFLPFQAGIEAGVDFIMVSHNTVRQVDNVPASLSNVFHEILNEELGFSGLIITDDLAMSAITKKYSNEQAAVQAVLAGNNMLIVSNYQVAFNAILDAVKNGTITEERIDYLLLPVISLKIQKNLIKIE